MIAMSNEEKNKSEDSNNKEYLEKSRLKRALYFSFGTICLILGIFGIILPILPTTPFLLLATAAYFRSSEKAYNAMLNNRVFGKYIRNYREGKGLPVRVRIFTITFLWITIIISMIIIGVLWIILTLIVIGLIVSIHVAQIKPKNLMENQ
jgi:uncharacterized protein